MSDSICVGLGRTYGVADVARVLSVSHATARRIVLGLAHLRVGGRLRLQEHVLRDYVASCHRTQGSTT